MRSVKKVKIIGFPFAKSQIGIGAAATPSWLRSQHWFQNLQRSHPLGIEFEQVDVKEINRFNLSNKPPISDMEPTEEKLNNDDIRLIVHNCELLAKHVRKALKEGYYPVILGGDNCQTLGSAKAYKSIAPGTKTLWIDSMIDIDVESKKSPDFRALEVQTGFSDNCLNKIDPDVELIINQQKCMELSKDIAFVGVDWNNNQEAINFLQNKGVNVIGNWMCQPALVDELHSMI